jgi:3-deoxy-D-manno-octulosonic-acid transferase
MTAIGGQNMLEPAALGKPVIVGPHTFNFSDIVQQLIGVHGALQIQDTRGLEEVICRLFGEPQLRERMGRAGLELVNSGKGALKRTLDLVNNRVNPTAG